MEQQWVNKTQNWKGDLRHWAQGDAATAAAAAAAADDDDDVDDLQFYRQT